MEREEIFDLPIDEFEKEFEKILDCMSDDEFINILEANDIKITDIDVYYSPKKYTNYNYAEYQRRNKFDINIGHAKNLYVSANENLEGAA